MAKRLRNNTRIPIVDEELEEGPSSRSFALRGTTSRGVNRVDQQRVNTASDSSRERRDRKRSRNNTTFSGRNATSAARESRNRVDSSNRNYENDTLLNITSSRNLTQSHSVLDNSSTDLVKRAFDLFNQARTASQSMETLVSENENVLQGFKLFLEDNLPQPNSAKNGCAKCRECVQKEWKHSCRCHRDEAADMLSDRQRSQSSQTSFDQPGASQDSVMWPQEVLSPLKCTICQDFCHQCVTACPCGHLFCGGCLSTWFDRCGELRTCPTCRERVLSVHKNLPAEYLIQTYLNAHPEEKRSDEELSGIHTQDRLFVSGVSIFGSVANHSQQSSHRAPADPLDVARVLLVSDDDDDESDNDSDSTLNSYRRDAAVVEMAMREARSRPSDSEENPNEHRLSTPNRSNLPRRPRRQNVETRTRASARIQSYTERARRTQSRNERHNHQRSPAVAFRTRRAAARNQEIASSSGPRQLRSPRRDDRSPENTWQGGFGCTVTTNQGVTRIRGDIPGRWYHMQSSNTGDRTIDIRVNGHADNDDYDDRLSEASQDMVTSMLEQNDQSEVPSLQSEGESDEDVPLSTVSGRNGVEQSNGGHYHERSHRRGGREISESNNYSRHLGNRRLQVVARRMEVARSPDGNTMATFHRQPDGPAYPYTHSPRRVSTENLEAAETADESSSNESELTSSNRSRLSSRSNENESESESDEEEEPVEIVDTDASTY